MLYNTFLKKCSSLGIILLVCVLNKNGVVLKVVDYISNVKLNYTTDSVSYLVYNDKHYFVLKSFKAGGSLFKLDPIRPNSFLSIINFKSNKV